MIKVNDPCGCNAHFHAKADAYGVVVITCNECGHQDIAYDRPDTGNHPDHPPVEGGYRGAK
jgi:hypothetical protein